MKKPRASEGYEIKLTSMDPTYILKKAEWLGVPLSPENLRIFLRNVETAVFKYLEHGHQMIDVSYSERYTVHRYKMDFYIDMDLQDFIFRKTNIQLLVPGDIQRIYGHSCVCSDSSGKRTNLLRKRGVIPFKDIPLLINNVSPPIQLLAKAKLQGVL